MIFKGKRIIITGASRGLGSVCAKEFDKLGAKLVLIARTKKELEELRNSCQNSKDHLSIAADLTDMTKLKRSINKAKEHLGDVDAVLHSAGGGLGIRDPFLKADNLNKLFMLNVVVSVEINRLILPDMIKRGKGNLVHVCSIASSEAAGSVGYNTVKAALAGYVRSLGREVARSGVVVTGILPGGFYSPGNSWSRMKEENPKIVKEWIKERLPRQFMGDAKELIPMLTLLCSNDASMMGGCLVPIDAGEGKSYFV